MNKLIDRLRSSGVVIGMLPELPGYNGSVLTIDDTEAERVSSDISAAVDALEKMTKLVRLIFASTHPYTENGKCVFSDEVTDAWKELEGEQG